METKKNGSLIRNLVRQSIRQHGLSMLFFILIQIALSAYADEFADISGYPRDQIINLHATLGFVLAGFAVFLFLEKIYILVTGMDAVGKIPNVLIASSIKGHFLPMSLMILAQVLTAWKSDDVAAFLDIDINFVYSFHKYNGYAIGAFALFLTFEKMYLNTVRMEKLRASRLQSKKSEAASESVSPAASPVSASSGAKKAE